MAASSALLSSPPALTLILKRKPRNFINAHHSFSPSNHPIFGFPSTQISTRTLNSGNSSSAASLKPIRNWRFSAVNGNYLLSEVTTEENLQEVVSTTDDGVSTVISALLFFAFVGLAILTVGVIYIAVTDFLQKRERDKFEKEEAARKKRTGKKSKIGARSKAGPRGFGQKIEEFDDDDDAE
ncbi:uncharacterized protein LOC111405891 [Olea europaea subsp. europaea]|uniref:Uncharacterized protein LOC111405891 n=1 Tax=Olea europaea subsp. europaea TaxID=158383 RepID=A0A8S0TE97_OLEEU|nr:uncharacterized protein LOC111405891 [Olea europaea subsp. europaea]